MSIEVKISKIFKGFTLDIDFKTEQKSLGILGASGCGKSMTLKCIAGIEKPDCGRIVLDGRVLFDSSAKINLPPQQRKVGYLFQNYALFPTMTVLENVEAGIKEKDRDKRKQEAVGLIEKMGLSEVLGHYPAQISGGQQQRAALARMLAAKPEMILLDEPFSALDSYLKDNLQREMKTVMDNFDGHVLMVSHSRDELYRLCTEMAVLDQGHILHMDQTKALFDNPVYVQAARLTGCKNISKIKRLGEYGLLAEDWGLELKTARPVTGDVTHIGIRAHHFIPVFEEAEEKGDGILQNCFPAVLQEVSESPFEIHYFMKNKNAPDRQPVWWKVPKFSVNEAADKKLPGFLSVRPEDIMLLKDSGSK